MKLLIATKNPGKFTEISEILGSLPIQLLSLADLKVYADVEEHGLTHEENAILKVCYFFEKRKIPTLGEDSGIYIDAFPGELGVQTRRWGGLANATDREWVEYFLEKMKKLPLEKRTARFVCHVALILDEKSFEDPFLFAGETYGMITETLEAPMKPGIPISSCFRPEGFKKVYAALTLEEKNKVSHRGKAITKVRDFLKENLILSNYGV